MKGTATRPIWGFGAFHGRAWPIAFRKPNAPSPMASEGLDLQATGLHVEQQLLPGLLALPMAVGHGDRLLLALGGRPHQDQDAPAAPLQADVEMDAVGPDMDVSLARQRPPAPRLILALADGLEPGDGGGREPRRVGAEDRLEGLGESEKSPVPTPFRSSPGISSSRLLVRLR